MNDNPFRVNLQGEPLVSIVTPSYNQGEFIEDTILSVKNQDYPNIEHIVVDGGSTDNTLEILKKYEDTYNLRWLSEPDEGQSEAINKGFDLAKGEIVAELDSDDVYFDKQVISYVVNQFKNQPDCDVIYGDSVLINQDNLILRVRHAPPWFNYNQLRRVCFIIQPSVFLKRDIIQSHKLDINIDLPMDYEYWLRLGRAGFKFKHAGKILSAFREHTTSKTIISRREELKAESKKVKNSYGQKFGVQYYLLRQLDNLLLLPLRIRGAITIIKLFSNLEKPELTFPAKSDSVLKALSRQLFQLSRSLFE